MSAGHVETALQVFEALGRGDATRLIELSDPEVERHSFFAQLREGGMYRGHPGLQEYVDDLQGAWEHVRAEVDDWLEVGDFAVFVGRIHYRGRASGLESASPAGWVFKFRDGKVLLFRAFREPEQALGAVGRPA